MRHNRKEVLCNMMSIGISLRAPALSPIIYVVYLLLRIHRRICSERYCTCTKIGVGTSGVTTHAVKFVSDVATLQPESWAILYEIGASTQHKDCTLMIWTHVQSSCRSSSISNRVRPHMAASCSFYHSTTQNKRTRANLPRRSRTRPRRQETTDDPHRA
jgi:hypothetical protein